MSSRQCAAPGRVCGQHLAGTSASPQPAPADHAGWDGKRRISYQQQKDLFYNYYAQPGPFYNTPCANVRLAAAGAGERRPHLHDLPAVHAARVHCTTTNGRTTPTTAARAGRGPTSATAPAASRCRASAPIGTTRCRTTSRPCTTTSTTRASAGKRRHVSAGGHAGLTVLRATRAYVSHSLRRRR